MQSARIKRRNYSSFLALSCSNLKKIHLSRLSKNGNSYWFVAVSIAKCYWDWSSCVTGGVVQPIKCNLVSVRRVWARWTTWVGAVRRCWMPGGIRVLKGKSKCAHQFMLGEHIIEQGQVLHYHASEPSLNNHTSILTSRSKSWSGSEILWDVITASPPKYRK